VSRGRALIGATGGGAGGLVDVDHAARAAPPPPPCDGGARGHLGHGATQGGHVRRVERAQVAGQLAGMGPARHAQHGGGDRVRRAGAIAVATLPAARRQGRDEGLAVLQVGLAVLQVGEAAPPCWDGQPHLLLQGSPRTDLLDQPTEAGQAGPGTTAQWFANGGWVRLEPIDDGRIRDSRREHGEPPRCCQLDPRSLPWRLAFPSLTPEMRIPDG
jgi:hypothetical protein